MKNYDAKLAGTAAGFIAIIIYLLVIINILITNDVQNIKYIVPFIPFLNSMNFLGIAGGLVAAWLWGFFLGWLFVVFYNFYYRLFSKVLKNNLIK